MIGEYNEHGQLEISGVGTSPSEGLRRGVVINIEATLKSVRQAVEAAEMMSGRDSCAAYITGIAGGHIEGINSRGVVAVSGRGREIAKEDIDRVIDAAKAIVIPMDREVLHVIPQEFIVDDQGGIRNPLDMIGVRLEAEVHIITGSVTSAQNLISCVNRAGFKVNDIVLESLAAAKAVLSKRREGTRRAPDRSRRRDDGYPGASRRCSLLYQRYPHRGSAGDQRSRLSCSRRRSSRRNGSSAKPAAAIFRLSDDDEEVIIPGVGGVRRWRFPGGNLQDHPAEDGGDLRHGTRTGRQEGFPAPSGRRHRAHRGRRAASGRRRTAPRMCSVCPPGSGIRPGSADWQTSTGVPDSRPRSAWSCTGRNGRRGG